MKRRIEFDKKKLLLMLNWLHDAYNLNITLSYDEKSKINLRGGDLILLLKRLDLSKRKELVLGKLRQMTAKKKLLGFNLFEEQSSKKERNAYKFLLALQKYKRETTGVGFYQIIPKGSDPRDFKEWFRTLKASANADSLQADYADYIKAVIDGYKDWDKFNQVPILSLLSGAMSKEHYLNWKIKNKKYVDVKENLGFNKKEWVEYKNQVERYKKRCNKIEKKTNVGGYLKSGYDSGTFPKWFVDRYLKKIGG